MKKRTILLSLCLCLAILLSSCSNQTTQNDNVESNQSESKEVQYSLYLVDNYNFSTVNLNLPSDQIQTKPADEKTFSFSTKTKIEDPNNEGSSHTLKIAGQSYDLDYYRTYTTKLCESDRLKSHAEIIDFRKNKIRAEYRASDGALLFFSNLNREARNISGDLTEDEAKELAVSTLTEVYGKDIFNEYVFDYVLFTDNQSTKHCSVVYTKYVHGIPTNDMIQLGFNLKGELIAINSLMLGVYDNAEKDITKEQIDNALAYLNDTLGAVALPTLIVDSLGDYYLQAYSGYSIVYINIE